MVELALGRDRATASPGTDARRVLQLVLAAIWLLDGLLQYQSFMYTGAFGQMLGGTAAGNPGVVADPISWNAALVAACAKYPNMRIYNWAAAVRSSWFISDGIHYTSAGYAARAELIADALARAFPAGGCRGSCTTNRNPHRGSAAGLPQNPARSRRENPR